MQWNRFFLLLLFFPFLSSFAEPIDLKPHPIHRIHPILTTGAIIEIYQEGLFQGIVLIERGKNPFGKALPGGKVEWGETVEEAVRREMKEETDLELDNLRQFHVYSAPMRDARHHSVEVTYIAQASALPKGGDDAKEAFVVKLDEIPWDELVFDHATILKDYLSYRNTDHSSNMVIP